MEYPYRRQGRRAVIGVLAGLLGVLIAGCSGGSSGGGTNTGTRGTLAVSMVDAPTDPEKVKKVEVTLNRVEANVNGTWTPINFTPVRFNLLDLVTREQALGTLQLPAGSYTQVRFFPDDMEVTDANDVVHDVDIPSGSQTGIKVNVNYDIEPNTLTTILLDVNVKKSLHLLGNGRYQFQPVVQGAVKVLSGTITGSITNTDGTPLPGAVVTATYAAGSSYPVGTEVNTAVSRAEDGVFRLWALLPGMYNLSVSYTDPATNAVRTTTHDGVVVNANQDTNIGAIPVP
jgi:hypothetical protein